MMYSKAAATSLRPQSRPDSETQNMRSTLLALALGSALMAIAPSWALAGGPTQGSDHVLPELGVRQVHLEPQYWSAQLVDPAAELADRRTIEAQNARLFDEDPSMYRMDRLPDTLPGEQVRKMVERLASFPPEVERWDIDGEPVPEAT